MVLFNKYTKLAIILLWSLSLVGCVVVADARSFVWPCWWLGKVVINFGNEHNINPSFVSFAKVVHRHFIMRKLNNEFAQLGHGPI